MNQIEHTLTIIMEECSEIQKACAKALRFGLDDTYRDTSLPKWELTPRQEIRKELNDLRGAVSLARHLKIIPELTVEDDEQESQKIIKIYKLFDYSIDEGTLIGEIK